MEIGLVGLPNAGKSTLFNALTKAAAPAAAYAFTTIEPNIGIAAVPDERFDKITELIKPQNKVPAVVKFVDIAGLVKGASEGEGLGNKFLGHIREVDAIAQVVRCFEDDIPYVANQVSPADDIETINTELALADLATCAKRAEKLEKLQKTGDKKVAAQAQYLEELMEQLSKGRLAGNYKHIGQFSDLNLLTDKPMIFVANISEENFRKGNYSTAGHSYEEGVSPDNYLAQPVEQYAKEHDCDTVTVSAKVEAELAELDEEDAAVFRQELGLKESSLNKLIRASYHTLSLMSFFTVGPNECRAWTVKQGASAVEAAAKIHTDFARGFIKAEVINYAQLLEDGSYMGAREKGHLRLEGKDYLVQDGDVIHFKFNV